MIQVISALQILMYGYLLKDNVVAAKLASMAHAMDFFTKEEYLTPAESLFVIIAISKISMND